MLEYSSNRASPHLYLYKILLLNDWQESQNKDAVKLASADDEFIHFSTEDQLERIIEKYWSGVPEFVVLKIDATKLPGKLVLEANPGGSNKYYHLYDGFIPMSSIFECELKRGSDGS